MAETKNTMTLDEALALISEVARNGEGADKFRALKIVMSQESGNAALPDPLSDAEIIDRISRILKASGPTAAQLGYRKAFPHAQRPINHSAPKITEADVMPIDVTKLPRDLRSLYKMFPEIKRGGFPKGFPVNAGLAVRAEWCQKQARKMLLDREQKRFDLIAVEAAPEAPDAP